MLGSRNGPFILLLVLNTPSLLSSKLYFDINRANIVCMFDMQEEISIQGKIYTKRRSIKDNELFTI